MAALRMTTPRLLVLRVLLDEPAQERYGLDVARTAGLEPGTIYPILVAFEGVGWLTSWANRRSTSTPSGAPAAATTC